MSDQKELRGFLVVLQEQEYPPWVTRRAMPTYKGVYRIPAAPTPGEPAEIPEEAEALDAYVFGDFKDCDTNLIPAYDKAVKLLGMFSRSPRRYEIIFCCTHGEEEQLERLASESLSVQPLGYDVAGVEGDYWSIVDDMPESPWAEPFRARLNGHGLFSNKEDAEQYLRAYQNRGEPDWDAGLRVVFVARVLPS